MNLSTHITDLLFKFDCVIIPNFGGFVTNRTGASIDHSTRTFNPPSKQITFNSFLKHNDGLLANHVATVQNVSFEQANILIDQAVAKWNFELNNSPIIIESIGSLFLNDDKQVCFEPDAKTNFLTHSFGLTSIDIKPIQRVVKINEEKSSISINNLDVEADIIEGTSKTSKQRLIPIFVKYAASVAILMTLGYTGFDAYQKDKQQQMLVLKQQEVEHKIQKATFIIDNPLPTVNLSISKKEITKDVEVKQNPYYIIAGAFQQEVNAQKKVNQLVEKGYNSEIVGQNKWGLIQVCYDSYDSFEDAKIALKHIKATVNSDAWILVK